MASTVIDYSIGVRRKSQRHRFANRGHPAAYTIDNRELEQAPLLRFEAGARYRLRVNGGTRHPFYLSAAPNTAETLPAGASGANAPDNVMGELRREGVLQVDAPLEQILRGTDGGRFALFVGTLTLDFRDQSTFARIRARYPLLGYNCAFHAYMGGTIQWTNNDVGQKETRIATEQRPRLSIEALQGEPVFQSPVALASTPRWPADLFVAEQRGVVWRIDIGTGEKFIFMDIRRFIRRLRLNPAFDERGLLDIQFAPDFDVSADVYVFYSARPNRAVRVNNYGQLSVFRVDLQTKRAIDGTEGRDSTETLLLQVEEPFSNHNGGRFVFGRSADTEDYLYVGLGDGGSADDPGDRVQNLANVHGKVLRLDYKRRLRAARQGAPGSELRAVRLNVPRSNPFVNDPRALPEIYAYGFRNPWGLSWSNDGTQLIVADVGQDAREELSIVRVGQNHGWPLREGRVLTDKGRREQVTSDARTHNRVFAEPVLDYQTLGGGAIIGGYPIVGTGYYVFGDFQSTLMVADMSNARQWTMVRRVRMRDAASSPLFVKAFGRDHRGQVYVLTSVRAGPGGDEPTVAQDRVFRVFVEN